MKTTLLTLFCAAAVSASAQTSPDGRLRAAVEMNAGVPCYSVILDNDTVIRRSELGLKTSIGDFTHDLQLASVSDPKKVSESYTLKNAKKANISYEANEQIYTFNNSKGAKAFDLVMHVDNNNVAFKYVVYAQKVRADYRLSCLVEKESTEFAMPQGTTTFLCPQMTPQTGFARTAPSYETFYEYDAEMGKNGHGRGYTFPALFKVNNASSPIWVMLCETNVGGNYCASRIEYKANGTYALAYPEQTEFGGVGTAEPGLMLRNPDNKYFADIDDWGNSTPWRTITVGRTMKPIAETSIMWDLVRPQYEASQDYKYGRSAWSWIIRMDSSCNYDEQKEYIDFASTMGWEYLLVDAHWDSNIGHERIAELSRYAQSKGVALFLWYNSNGYWNDAPQGPRGRMYREITRRKEMAWMQKIGVKGIKVDFVGSDKQQSMQMYEDILADANDYGIMVIFHGCTIPRGWERMYPNFVACEAVRASENLSFGQYDNDVEAQCGTIHPVLRNAIGNMDFGGSALNKHYSTNNQRGNTRRTSDAYALATAVLLQTPVQNFALAPNNLTDAPDWAIEFMKSVPVEWNDMRYIDGYPGKYLIMARQSKDGKWYVAAINADDKPVVRTLSLDMFEAGKTLTVYCDDAKKCSIKTNIKLNKKQQIKISVPKNGATLICE